MHWTIYTNNSFFNSVTCRRGDKPNTNGNIEYKSISVRKKKGKKNVSDEKPSWVSNSFSLVYSILFTVWEKKFPKPYIHYNMLRV